MDYMTYIEPELLITVPVLYGFGKLVKKSAVPDRYIPIILGILGVLLAVAYKLASYLPTNASGFFALFFAGTTQGLLCAAGGVYTDNIIRQLKGKGNDSENNHKDG